MDPSPAVHLLCDIEDFLYRTVPFEHIDDGGQCELVIKTQCADGILIVFIHTDKEHADAQAEFDTLDIRGLLHQDAGELKEVFRAQKVHMIGDILLYIGHDRQGSALIAQQPDQFFRLVIVAVGSSLQKLFDGSLICITDLFRHGMKNIHAVSGARGKIERSLLVLRQTEVLRELAVSDICLDILIQR